ncbi:hypothetical protein BRARA_G01808 [Brassica rapa]|uniref:No apical meristem-associated C-terminal domain-containing protein n=1 Tax=Brassica campestris TaxID=3711 RepID=A0A397YMG2_BRACM|nr:hypothetical protein BRARA_G01808 [Brassica rapa]
MKDAVNDSFSPGSSRPSPSMLSREDYWSEEATFTLIQAWGRRYVDLSRGGLRQKHWQEVANAVNDPAASPAYEDDSDGSRSRSSGGNNRKREREREVEIEEKKGYKEVAEAIERFGKIYEKVEERKRKEMVELEKQRMRFAKELECHRMQLFTEMQVRLHKLRRSSGSNGPTSSANAALEYGMMDFPSYF